MLNTFLTYFFTMIPHDAEELGESQQQTRLCT
jgi:hypothetical protein